MAGRTLTIYLDANTRQATAELGAFGKTMAAFGRAAKVAAVAGVAVAGAALVKLGADSIEAASKLQQADGAIETVFGRGNAAKITAWAKAAAQDLGLAESAYKELAATVGAQLTAYGLSTSDALGKTKTLIQAGADLAATFGGTTQQAVEALGSAFRGEFDPIEKYGIAIKAADIQARLAAKGQDELTGAALKQAQATAAYDLIMKQAARSSGAFSREAGTLAGSQQRLQAQLENVKATIGQALLPAVTELTRYIANQVLPKFQAWWSEHGPAVTKALKDLAKFITDSVMPAIGDLAKGIQPGLTSVFNAVDSAIDRVSRSLNHLTGNTDDAGKKIDWLDALTMPFRVNMKLVATAVDLFAAGVENAAAQVSVLITAWKTIIGWASSVVSAINKVIAALNSIPGTNLPSLPGGSGGQRSGARSYAAPVTVNVTAGFGTDPIALARQIERVLATRHVRVGA